MRRLACVLMVLAFPATLRATDYHLYFLGGQSNMVGLGKAAEIDAARREPIDGVMIFHGHTAQPDGGEVRGEGGWATLRPGHGKWGSYNNSKKSMKYSGRFGPELSFGWRMKQLYPDRAIAILKVAHDGVSIDPEAAGQRGCWDPDYSKGNGVNHYDHFLAALRYARDDQDIDDDGEPDRLIPAGIVWMQGESDAANSEAVARRYKQNLAALLSQLRADLGKQDIPVAIGRISNSADAKVKPRGAMRWPHAEIVREQQAAFVEADGRAALITSTDEYGYTDPWHYDTAGLWDLGVRFAEALHRLETSAPESEKP